MPDKFSSRYRMSIQRIYPLAFFLEISYVSGPSNKIANATLLSHKVLEAAVERNPIQRYEEYLILQAFFAVFLFQFACFMVKCVVREGVS